MLEWSADKKSLGKGALRREQDSARGVAQTGAQHSLGHTPGRPPPPLAFTLHVGELTGKLQGPKLDLVVAQ